MKSNRNFSLLTIFLILIFVSCQSKEKLKSLAWIDSATVLWYTQPADKWENALPVGNGRLGAMVFGKTDEEIIQFNEETYWTGGPYSQARKAGWRHLPEVQQLIFEGKYIEAHKLFGRHLMGYPVEQQKYQSLGNLVLKFKYKKGRIANYIHKLDLNRALVTTEYTVDSIHFVREVFSSAVDQVIVIHLAADRPGQISFEAQLRGCRNQAHSNYATDYFAMDGAAPDTLILTGKSADYLGIEGKLQYEARLKAFPEGGKVEVQGDHLYVTGADVITLYLAAATNFVNYKDVSADPRQRVEDVLEKVKFRNYSEIKEDHIKDYQKWFGRMEANFGSSSDSFLPTDERLKRFSGKNDPALAALVLQFGRYLLISSSRPGTQPANLQGIWNDKMNPPWDSKYTTNINLEMNYWPAEAANLSELAEPLFRLIEDLSETGQEVARENYNARGWVFHQNTDIWRAAAPMDGPDWGTFTTGGAWLCTHLWEHYLYTGDKEFLARYYPILKDAAIFFLDFLVVHPKYGWLVTNPSTSPENFPARPDNVEFFDEVTGWMSPGTTICAGSTIDLAILRDLFEAVARSSEILGKDADFRQLILQTKEKLAPLEVGNNGALKEWLEDWPQKEKSHRHISNLYGLFPGQQISPEKTPELAGGARAVLEQRGLKGNGWSSAWKMACWARLYEPEKAMENFIFYIKNYVYRNLFAICSGALQVDGSFGAAAAIMEMLLQSHQGWIELLPALPAAWETGQIKGLKARGGFEVNLFWEKGKLKKAEVLSTLGSICRLRVSLPARIFRGEVLVLPRQEEGVIVFETQQGETYTVVVD
ncbi:MAG: glycoside hydrolase family 95 protein [Candidatus Aminicenantales bacterium]